ncbi:hypothetical protein CEUSTIGMA_g2413.t1 [Chlamydomonas eustigma]|uniref:SGNH hydrolase-type esterase domain-containing protein n=1 Tax=Chlamydomonas eustigma TaxID=1157962 RepID=A0A250WVW1_9CHLO|nr:hypothetical protein CEUSTIGMA_g2413.t1 [Chlamydomonas eustigma]|eukprot:GAX74967.1 hypothetical protein CEUSTIGMA_g2413.t1 [Chlamydomonas eustigma]
MLCSYGQLLILYSILTFHTTSTLSTDLEYKNPQIPRYHVPCHLGKLPGTWLESAPIGSQYQLLTWPGSNCQIKNYLAEATQSHEVKATENAGRDMSMTHNKTSILFLGDSVDRLMMEDVCALQSGIVLPRYNSTNLYDSFFYCYAPKAKLQLGYHSILGVHPTGPYMGAVQSPKTLQRIKTAVKEFGKVFAGPKQQLDAVVIASNFWDIGRICHPDVAGRDPKLCSGAVLPPWFLAEWMTNFTSVVNKVKEALGNHVHSTKLIYHTELKPRVMNYTSGEHSSSKGKLGRSQYVAQLNAAGRITANVLGMHEADFAVIAEGFTREQSLRDCHHPTEKLGLEFFNIYLNIIHQSEQPGSSISEGQAKN